jgi:manganese efflux pump family protein
MSRPVIAWITWQSGTIFFCDGRVPRYARVGCHPAVESESRHRKDPTRGWMLVTLSIATSLDALAVGLSMAMMHVSIWIPSVVIGLVAGGMTVVGIRFGGRFGPHWGQWAETVGGCVLLAIGVKMLLG